MVTLVHELARIAGHEADTFATRRVVALQPASGEFHIAHRVFELFPNNIDGQLVEGEGGLPGRGAHGQAKGGELFRGNAVKPYQRLDKFSAHLGAGAGVGDQLAVDTPRNLFHNDGQGLIDDPVHPGRRHAVALHDVVHASLLAHGHGSGVGIAATAPHQHRANLARHRHLRLPGGAPAHLPAEGQRRGAKVVGDPVVDYLVGTAQGSGIHAQALHRILGHWRLLL